MSVDIRRIRKINDVAYTNGAVMYWMNRDMRIEDNWAFIRAQEYAHEQKVPLVVVYNLVPNFLGGIARHWNFKVASLQELAMRCKEKNVSFIVTTKPAEDVIPDYIKKYTIGFLVTDFSPLKISQKWVHRVAQKVDIPFEEVDAHNIVPAFFISQKQEFAAYTLRPKIQKVLSEFLTEFPKHKYTHPAFLHTEENDFETLLKERGISEDVFLKKPMSPGSKYAHAVLAKFMKEKLASYADMRNDPNEDVQSGLSPYLHYGLISAQRVALEVEQSDAPRTAKDAFLEELIVRKELADNFCLYNEHYDSVKGFPAWAQATLETTKNDVREYVYTQQELEYARTHDPLWNAAQIQMLREGKMHGYMRMYWAKKILEWTKSPEDALRIALYLNDTYEYDGRDPNGYTGVAWSIGGVHDRAWFKRPVFGQIRYMNANGAQKKFDTEAYIQKYTDML